MVTNRVEVDLDIGRDLLTPALGRIRGLADEMRSGFGGMLGDIAQGARFAALSTAIDGVRQSVQALAYGNLIRIKHPDGNETGYAHLDSMKVHVGMQVRKGDVIGISGNTGVGTGAHLHLEFFKSDPIQVLNPADVGLERPYVGLITP